MSTKAKEELVDFKKRRVAAFRKNLIELAELEIKHAKVSICILYYLFVLPLPSYLLFTMSCVMPQESNL